MDIQEQDLVREIETMGLDAESARAIALLPLVEVAWVDGATQADERRKIVEIAKRHDLLRGKGAEVLKGWLLERPSPDYFERGRKVFVRLALRKQGVGADLPESALQLTADRCVEVAESAGGLFGLFFTTSTAEKAAIGRIVAHLQGEADQVTFDPKGGRMGRTITIDWKALISDLDEDV